MKKKINVLIALVWALIILVVIVNVKNHKELYKAAKESKVSVQGENTLPDKTILFILNDAQESFFKVTRNVKDLNGYGVLSEEFNSPEKLQNYFNLYWSKSSAKELMNFIGAKYVNNKYCITLGDAPNIDILGGKVLDKKQDKDRIYITLKANCLDEEDSYKFELKFEDNKWVADYFEGSFGVIGKQEQEENKEVKNTEITSEAAADMVSKIVPNKASNTVADFDREEVKEGVKYYVIHVFDNMPTHTATRGWYFVNAKDGKIYEWDVVTDRLKSVQ